MEIEKKRKNHRNCATVAKLRKNKSEKGNNKKFAKIMKNGPEFAIN